MVEHPWLLLRIVITSSQQLTLLCQNQVHPLLEAACCVLLESYISSFLRGGGFLLLISLMWWSRRKGLLKETYTPVLVCILLSGSRLSLTWVWRCDDENYMFQNWIYYSLQTKILQKYSDSFKKALFDYNMRWRVGSSSSLSLLMDTKVLIRERRFLLESQRKHSKSQYFISYVLVVPVIRVMDLWN